MSTQVAVGDVGEKRSRDEDSDTAAENASKLQQKEGSQNPWQPFYLFASEGVPSSRCIRLSDIFAEEEDGSNPITQVFVYNYLVGAAAEEGKQACPVLREVLATFVGNNDVSVDIYHGEKCDFLAHKDWADVVDADERHRFENWRLCPFISWDHYGCHHTKAFIVFYEKGVRVCIHTPNLRNEDVTHMTQGAWVQDFPLKSTAPPLAADDGSSSSSSSSSASGATDPH